MEAGITLVAGHIPMVYPGAMEGTREALVVRESVTIVPTAALGAKKTSGISILTAALAAKVQLLGSMMVRVWLAALIMAMAFVQLGSPTMTTPAWAGVADANTCNPAMETELDTANVTVPPPTTATLGVKWMVMLGTSPICRLLGVAVNCRFTVEARDIRNHSRGSASTSPSQGKGCP